MGMTPLPPTAPEEEVVLPNWLFGVLPAVLGPDGPPLGGLSSSCMLPVRRFEGGVVTGWCAAILVELLVDLDLLLLPAVLFEIDSVEFLRDAAVEPVAVFFERVLVPPTGRLAPDPRFLFLITSVFKLRGRTTPCSFKNRPQALQRG